MTATTTAHIVLDDRGRPWIDGTNVKVIEVARDKLAGMSPEQMHEEYPHLSLAQIHAALGYYDDHKAEIDSEMQRIDREVEAMRAQSPRQSTREELLEKARAKGIALGQ